MLRHLLGARYLSGNGYLLILRFTPRGFHRFRLDGTRSSSISLRIRWWKFFLAGGGNSLPDRELPAHYAYRMEKREPVRIFRNRPSRFVHQLADGKVCQQKTIELLPHQFRSFPAQHDLTSPEMRLPFVQRVFYLPSLVIASGQFFCRCLERIQDRSDQPVDRFGFGDAFQLVVNDTNSYAVRFVSRILFGRVDGAAIGTIAPSFAYL
jgi:hypothetical protein